MASIKQIDSHSIHQIQSGQVIVDLCSVVKELVENSVDAGATSIDVRFKNQGLDLIEVQDNGAGIAPDNYTTVGLKHHTSKLSTYADIASLQTFGFRGEALASLCALSTVSITTCQENQIPKGSRLSFELSGKLKGVSVVAAQRGTIVSVENLFHNLPVRRRELERNIKREWHKVVSLLNQYACIQTNLKFSVSQQPTKGKRIVLFSTKGNAGTRDNIINIFGAKTMTALVPLELRLEMRPSVKLPDSVSPDVCIVGYVSKPVHGEGRQTPDRQMFFVNGRPCGLPQFAKIFNEVYKSYNSHQSPFIFADIQLDTHMYDVNVSPDKRSILLHDQNHLLDGLRASLLELFDAQEYSVPLAFPTPGGKSSLKRAASGIVSTPALERRSRSRATESTEPSEAISSGGSDEEMSADESVLDTVPSRRYPRISTSKVILKKGPHQHLISQWVNRDTSRDSETLDVYGSGSIGDRQYLPEDEASSQDTAHRAASLGHVKADVLSKDQRQELSSTTEDRELGPGTRDAATDGPSPSSDQSVRASSSPDGERGDGVEDAPILPTKMGSRTSNWSTAELGKRLREPPEVIIGDEVLSKSPASTPKRPRRNETSRCPVADGPSFGGRLSQMFAAGSTMHPLIEREATSSSQQTQGDVSPEEAMSIASEQDRDTEDGRTDTMLVDDISEASEASRRRGSPSSDIEEMGEQEIARPVQPVAQPPEPASSPDEEAIAPKSKSTVPSLQPSQAGWRRKEATLSLAQTLTLGEDELRTMLDHSMGYEQNMSSSQDQTVDNIEDIAAPDAESKLPLIISKADFARIRVVGQFNLGFIISVRPAQTGVDSAGTVEQDELFIIDQHASDEKYNFERLQESTVVQSQRLVRPKRLELTALEEEIVMQNMTAIESNGFKVHVDTSGDEPVGSRCQVLALPLSRETTFSLSDFEELIALLGEESAESSHIVRPSKVRKMFAMRACRSSIMIGKALTPNQMTSVVRHMGELDKPWNCPHGRPTMRHLCRLQAWDNAGWSEDVDTPDLTTWQSYVGSG